MNQITTGIRGVLSQPSVYEFWSRIVGGERARAIFMANHVRPSANDKVLDLGCGTGELGNHLPTGARYFGIDISEDYVRRARQHLGNQATLRVGDASAIGDGLGRFNIVVAYGLLHHLNDDQTMRLFRNAASVLESGGRVLTADPVFTPNQNPARQALMRRDRGQHIRTPDAYVALAGSAFTSVKSNIYHNLLRIPYSHCLLECENASATNA